MSKRRQKDFSPDLLGDFHAEPVLRPASAEDLEGGHDEGRIEGTGGQQALSPLSVHESRRLEACETVIDRGLNTFIEVGQALSEIRLRRLYRAEHRTFEAYCKDRWGLKRQRAYELMSASEIAVELSENSVILPRRESHAAQLIPLAPEERQAAWRQIVDEHPGEQFDKLTASTIRKKVAESQLRKSYSAAQAESAPTDAEEGQASGPDEGQVVEELRQALAKAIVKGADELPLVVTGSWLIKHNLTHLWREIRLVRVPIDQQYRDELTLGELFSLGLVRPPKGPTKR